MNVTKRNFLKAGAIIAIVSAVFMLFTCFGFISSIGMIDEELMLNTITYETDYEYFENEDGSYYIEYFEDEDDLRPERLEQKDIQDMVKIAKGVLVGLSVLIFAISLVQFIFSVKILKNLKKGISKKSHIITLLVFSILTDTILTAAFMIVALCIKDNPKVTLENINEIATQSGEQLTIEQLEKTEDNKEDKE